AGLDLAGSQRPLFPTTVYPGANFAIAVFPRANFPTALLAGANLRGAIVRPADFRGGYYPNTGPRSSAHAFRQATPPAVLIQHRIQRVGIWAVGYDGAFQYGRLSGAQ